MYLARLFIQNYRSIRTLDLRFRKGKNVIVGKNNAGKSNIIRAIDLVLGEANPTYAKSENITINDFHCSKTKDGDGELKVADTLVIWCELCRDNGEDLNYDEINKCFGYYVYAEEEIEGDWRSKLPKRVPADSMPQDFADLFCIDEDDGDKKLYINPKLRNQRTFKDQFDDKHCFAYALMAKPNTDGTIQKEMRFLYRENTTSDWMLAFKPAVRTELLQSAILHSFRDPQNQLRLSNWTWYGKLMRHLTRTHEESAELRNAFNAVKEVSQVIFDEVREKIESTTLRVAFPGTTLHFPFNADNRNELYKNCVIYVDDGFKSQLIDKGAGIQSATIIGLFNYYTRHVNTTTSALLCVEEPEIYLHPHARRVISDRLDEFLDRARNQVILTTHSVEFIRTTMSDLNIILVCRDETGTTAKLVNAGEYKGILTDNNQNELFFAESVIACEGYDSYVIRAIADDLFPNKLDEQNVSVIAVSGKDRLAKLIELTTKLGIKCYAVADFYFLLRDASDDRIAFNAQAHNSVVDLPQRFFKQSCIFGENARAKVEAVKALRNKIKLHSAEEFYKAKRANDLTHEEEVSRVLSEWREAGVCILDGEIEHLSRDEEFLSADDGGKLSLGRVAALHQRLLSGEKVTDIFDPTQLTGFLKHVLGINFVADKQEAPAAYRSH